jgi:hypothetical protein
MIKFLTKLDTPRGYGYNNSRFRKKEKIMNATIEVKDVKCSCNNCACVVSVDKAIKGQYGKFYCSGECATGHKEGKGCHHHGCECG